MHVLSLGVCNSKLTDQRTLDHPDFGFMLLDLIKLVFGNVVDAVRDGLIEVTTGN